MLCLMIDETRAINLVFLRSIGCMEDDFFDILSFGFHWQVNHSYMMQIKGN